MAKVKVVTIDGPAASGKTSVSREVARNLGWPWVSTGAFYRGLAYVAIQSKADLANENALRELCSSKDWQVKLAIERTEVIYRGEDVSEAIYAEEVGSVASQVSHFPMVRKALLQAQRDCADQGPGLVAEGRDCGTVVFPKAEVKIYLTARSESRAERRALEKGTTKNETLAAQARRDAQDSSRKAAPLQIPENAVVLDTSELSLKDVVGEVLEIVRRKLS